MGQYRIPKAIPEFRESYALVCAEQSADTMVIFVHGFGGKPTSTWLDFQGLVKICSANYPWWDKCDLFFYSYESLRTPIGVNAQTLGRFLDHVLSNDATGSPRFPTSSRTSHTRLIFVGHSEGAVVIRRLLLDRLNAIEKANSYKNDLALRAAKTDIILNSQLRLFAPACMGTNFSSLLGFATSLSALVSAIASSSLVRNELLPNSPILRPIESETENAYAKFPGISGLGAKVLFGDQDQVVYTASYKCDEIAYAKDQDHFSICKPHFMYLRPLEFVS
jgi:pimeloyl-ACP methyl ester carboxylesterase